MLSGLVTSADVAGVERAGVPCVVLGQMSPDTGEPARITGRVVAPDDIGAGRLAARWLAARGRKRIAFIGEMIFPNLCHDRWLAGYRLGLLDAGLTPDPGLVAITHREYSGAAPALDFLAARKMTPDAYVVPDTRIGHSLVHCLGDSGCDIVLGGTPDTAASYHVDHLPLIGPDITALADVSLHLLLHARSLPRTPTEIYVRNITRNMAWGS